MTPRDRSVYKNITLTEKEGPEDEESKMVVRSKVWIGAGAHLNAAVYIAPYLKNTPLQDPVGEVQFSMIRRLG